MIFRLGEASIQPCDAAEGIHFDRHRYISPRTTDNVFRAASNRFDRRAASLAATGWLECGTSREVTEKFDEFNIFEV